MGKYVKNAIKKLVNYGVNPRKILSYMMYNYEDDSQDLFVPLKGT